MQRRYLLVSLLLTPLLAQCAGKMPATPDAPTVASVTVQVRSQILFVGDTVTFTAKALTADGQQITYLKVDTWTSSNPTVLAVTDRGAGSPRSPGLTTVTATIGGVSGSVHLSVVDGNRINTVVVDAVRSTLPLDDSVALTASAWNARGQAVTKPEVDAWASSNPAVVSVTDDGVATARAPGFATVTATMGGVSGSVDLTVMAGKPYLRILEVNGDSVRPNHRIQVANYFAITVRLSLPDSAARGVAIWVYSDEVEGEGGASLVATLVLPTPASGGTWDRTFVGYNAPAGEYDLVPMILGDDRVVGDSVPVSVTNSDVTPPDVKFVDPTDSAVVSEDSVSVVFTAADTGGLREYDVTFDWEVPLGGGWSMGPVSEGGIMSPSELVTSLRVQAPMQAGMPFLAGENRIIIAVKDMAWNWTVDTLTVFHPSATASPAAAPTVAVPSVPCAHPLGNGLCIVSRDSDGREAFVRRTLRFKRPRGR
jgi:hypothetical protein